VAQRLVRRLCPHCKRPVHLSAEQLLAAGADPLTLDEPIEAFEALGCARCHQGFQGRLGLYQTMPMTDNLGAIVLGHGAELSLRQTALTEGMRSLRALGLLWVQRGHTTMGEVLLNTPE